MNRLTGRSMAAVGVAISMSTQCLLGQSRELSLRVTHAVALLDSSHTERGIDSLRALLAQWPRDGAVHLRVRANIHLGAASLTLGLRDSALMHFAEAVGLNPFAVPDPEVFNPEVTTAFREVRASTAVVGVRVAADTVINAVDEGYLVALGVGSPGQVTVELVPPGGTAPGPTPVRLLVDSVASFVLPLRADDSLRLQPGDYRLTAAMLGTAAQSAILVLRVTRQPVDTAPHDPPLDGRQYRPETRPGALAKGSAFGGLLVGLAAAVLPSLVSDPEVSGSGIDLQAVSVGGGIAIAGIAGVFVARRSVPIDENAEYNRNLRASWEARDRQIGADNARRRSLAPLRIEVVPQ